MKKHTFGRWAAVGVLWFLVGMIGSRAGAADWKSMITIAKTQRDAQGNQLSLQSYDETIARGMALLLKDHLKWF